MTRTGKTVTSEFTLKPGLNSLIAAIAADAVTAGEDVRMTVAQYLGQALGKRPELVGEDKNLTQALVYNIGASRPTYIHQLGITKRRQAWYQKLGSPVGDRVYFIAANLDWRGPQTHFSVPAGNVVVPSDPRVVDNNWPDGTSEQQRKRLADEVAARGLSELNEASRKYWATAQQVAATSLDALQAAEQQVLDHLVPGLPGLSYQFNILLMLGIGAAGIFILNQLDQKGTGGAGRRALMAAALKK